MIVQQHSHSSISQSLPPCEPQADPERRLEIAILLTSYPATAAAINCAATLLHGLNGRISLLDIKTIPHQLSLDNPPISAEFTKQRIFELASMSSVETTGYVYFCRSQLDALTSILKPGSLIVIGCQRRWWPTWEAKLARKLRNAGFQVIVHES